MNRISIIGRLVADPELRTTNNGVQVCSFRVAVNRRFKSDETDFFPVSVWREAGLNCNKFLRKGSQVAVTGQLQIRNYEQDGVKRMAIDIMADEVEFLTPKSESGTNYEKPVVKELEEVSDGGDMPF